MTLDRIDLTRPPAIVVQAEDPVAVINDLEMEAFEAEGESSDIRWQQAEAVVAALGRGMTLRQLAHEWVNVDTGQPYSLTHVSYVAKTWRAFVHLSEQDRPRWNTAYNSELVRGSKANEPEPDDEPDEALPGDEWYTPKWLFDALGLVFSIDVCSPIDRTHVNVPTETYFTEIDDGLAQEWEGLIWCNPPYSTPEPWATRCVEHGNGLLLVHMPMNAGWCVDVWHAADGIRLFQGMEFVRPDGTSQRPGYWLQLAAFGDVAAQALASMRVPAEVAVNPRRVPSPMWVAHAA